MTQGADTQLRHPRKLLILLPDTFPPDTSYLKVSALMLKGQGMSFLNNHLQGRTVVSGHSVFHPGGHFPPSLEGGCPRVRTDRMHGTSPGQLEVR
jgi:hypothetical protein